MEEPTVEHTDEYVDHPKPLSICAIDKKSVHRICSGQVVLTLATAIKELLENSIDANANIVDIKLKDFGSELIEVSDNGTGVQDINFQGLTLKHYTSKLQDFSDLINVDTFGFRGEALSSLCALSNMTVITRHETAAVGTRLEFDHNGIIIKQTLQARPVGTTVLLQNLFYTLPVRHKEFHKNVKKEFTKMVHILNSYGIISTGVKITCNNQVDKECKSTVVSTKGNTSIQDNISNIFGPKQMTSLLEFKQKVPEEAIFAEYGIETCENVPFRIEGYVSKCDHGQGRSSTDRQFFFINGRPFDSSKLVKVVNEVYHQYNRHQYPFVVLKITLHKNAVDVNVTPDKRQIFLEGEKLIWATVKASLIAMYESATSCLPILSADSQASKLRTELVSRLTRHESLEKTSALSSLMKLKRSFTSAFSKESVSSMPSSTVEKSHQKQRKLDYFISPKSEQDLPVNNSDDIHSISKEIQLVTQVLPELEHNINETVLALDACKSEGITEDADDINVDQDVDEKGSVKCTIISELADESKSDISCACLDKMIELADISACNNNAFLVMDADHLDISSNDEIVCNSRNVTQVQENNDDRIDMSQDCSWHIHEHNSNILEHVSVCKDLYLNMPTTLAATCEKELLQTHEGLPVIPVEIESHCKVFISTNEQPKSNFSYDLIEHVSAHARTRNLSSYNENTRLEEVNIVQQKKELVEDAENIAAVKYDFAENIRKRETLVSFSIESLKSKLRFQVLTEKDKACDKFARTFRATISPSENQAAEQELQKAIKKEMFQRMQVIGQFNLGFIITKLDNDLFIVDQHATDEKFNFEMLQRDTVIQSQKLIFPLNLELTSIGEMVLMDNIDIFRTNGFEFVIDEQGLPTQRVKLISTPVSRNWNFGKDDIEEMIFMLTDCPGVMCRPSRVRAMFASRACRKSVMIGTTLNNKEMTRLVYHMGEIEQPWNCPHGRPTIRHLINLDMVPR